MWQSNRLTERLGMRYPIVQGPFGSGLSSVELLVTVSEAGGLGSFGMQLSRRSRSARSVPSCMHARASRSISTCGSRITMTAALG